MTGEAGTKSFLEHIEELRQRLFRALLFLAAGTLVSALFAQRLLQWLARPIGGLENLESVELTENVGVFMKATLLGGVTLAMPFILHQLWRFISPGLYRRERRYVYLLIPLATLLFLGGAGFAYFVMLPVTVTFLKSFASIPNTPRPASYISFVTNVIFWIGLSFETPLVIFFLAKVRIVNHRMLAQNWRIAILAMAILAAVITPTPDPINMALVMGPMLVLYVLSIFLAFLAYRSVEQD